MKFRIRRAKIGDLKIILRILRSTPELQGSTGKVDAEYTKADVEDAINNKERNITLVCESDSRIVGILTAELWRRRRYSLLADIAVLKGFRDQGVGTALYETYEKMLKKDNIHSLAGIMLVGNRKMEAFCRKEGIKLGKKLIYLEKRL